jgi:NAD(P)H-binding
MPEVCASASRWWYALRDGWTARGSSIPPTSRSGAAWARGGRPLIMTEPLVGWSRPRIIRMVVDFPAPFGPRKPVTVPGWTVNVRANAIQASDLDWTVIRAPRITRGGPTGRARVGQLKLGPFNSVSNADIAELALRSLTDAATIGTAPMIANGGTQTLGAAGYWLIGRRHFSNRTT